ncbi:hypothetical protein QBC34DRAFT_196608 [Podospora aff. communis PSN243]|uniref:C2H2-type domain-containing protein n=1 Tax=Podospora aff. communis PSN243 TaxID=3040156 RepID=A0AAV9G7D5_9PEZI|nr:hypothetical protein QBC34DRAFT_196608 [Podospora aff. communis PSN243]
MDRTSGKPSPSESPLSKRKAAIIAKSMAEVERYLDQWLDNAKPMKRPSKRAREDTDSGAEEDAAAVTQQRTSKAPSQKRPKREQQQQPTRRFACPFARHNPAKFKNERTCCGPGWTGVHRVKEHVYRCHLLKNRCNRCSQPFDDAKLLKEHQRAATPCPLRDDAPTDFITEDQEKLLHARAKPNSSAEDNWRDMYRIIFPSAKTIPSPFYDTSDPEPTPSKTSSEEEDLETSRFKDVDECKRFVKREFLRAVKPVIEAEVERVLQVVEAKVQQKAIDIFKDFQTRLTRTLQYQSEQAELLQGEAPVTPLTEPDLVPDRVSAAVVQPDFGPIFSTLGEDPMFSLVVPEGGFNWNGWMMMPGEGGYPGEDGQGRCLGVGAAASVHDSAYFTSSGDEGGSGSWRVGDFS